MDHPYFDFNQFDEDDEEEYRNDDDSGAEEAAEPGVVDGRVIAAGNTASPNSTDRSPADSSDDDYIVKAFVMRKARFLERNKRTVLLRAFKGFIKSLTKTNNCNSDVDTSSSAYALEFITSAFSALTSNGSPTATSPSTRTRDGGTEAFDLVINKKLQFIKLGSVYRARKTHFKLTQLKLKRFQKFMQKWLTDHVSDEDQQQCDDLLFGKTSAANFAPFKTKVVLQTDLEKPPYRIYNLYRMLLATTASSR